MKWYFSPEGYRKRSKKRYSYDDIKDTFGVNGTYKNEKQKIEQ